MTMKTAKNGSKKKKAEMRKALSEKWGKHATESTQKKMQKSETYRSFSVNVKRSNPMATR